MDKIGQTPLLWAAANGHADIVEYLIAEGAELNKATNTPGYAEHEKTALHWAIERGHSVVACALIQANADIKIQLNNKLPIHFAAKKGRIAIVKALCIFR